MSKSSQAIICSTSSTLRPSRLSWIHVFYSSAMCHHIWTSSASRAYSVRSARLSRSSSSSSPSRIRSRWTQRIVTSFWATRKKMTKWASSRTSQSSRSSLPTFCLNKSSRWRERWASQWKKRECWAKIVLFRPEWKVILKVDKDTNLIFAYVLQSGSTSTRQDLSTSKRSRRTLMSFWKSMTKRKPW